MLFAELSELAGQRNAIDGRIVEIVAEIDRDELCGLTGARSVAGLVAWKLGTSPGNANTITTVAGRLEEFPRCTRGLREGRLSLDQVGVIAGRAAEEGRSDDSEEVVRNRMRVYEEQTAPVAGHYADKGLLTVTLPIIHDWDSKLATSSANEID